MIMKLKAVATTNRMAGLDYKKIDVYAIYPSAMTKENSEFVQETSAVCLCDGETEVISFNTLVDYIKAGMFEIVP